MKTNSSTFNYTTFFLFLAILATAMYSCTSTENKPENKELNKEIIQEKTPEEIESIKLDKTIKAKEIVQVKAVNKIKKKNKSPQYKEKINNTKLEEYKVELAVDENFCLHEKGELRVWIGAKDIEVNFEEGMAVDKTTIPANIGQYARITPYAPDFDIYPAKRECVKIDPSGSDVRFTLTPKRKGNFKVSANIELFTSEDCTGASVPKTAKTLTVNISVDNKYVAINKLSELGNIFWDKFISFWGALITFLLAVVLFVIRRTIKRKTGYQENE